MITRENLEEIIKQGDKSEDWLDSEYVQIEACFFNVGASVTLTPINDLPYNYDVIEGTGDTCFLESSDQVFDSYRA
jgi:hypothetical protein